MDRRSFIKKAGVAGTVGAASLATPALSQGIKEMTIVSTWPRDFPGLGISAQRLAARITQLSEGKLTTKYFAAGERVGAFDSFDEVRNGNSNAYIAADYYWKGKHPGFAYYTSVPFGMTTPEWNAWIKFKGGQELWDELSAEFGLKAITGSGDEINTGVYTSKGVVGYDLTRLLIGSEGTMAIITEATLKLTPLAQCTRTLQAIYRDIHSAAAAVSSIMAQPIVPCALEFIDKAAINMIRNYADIELPDAGAMLMIEVDGNEENMEFASRAIETAARNSGLLQINTAQSEQERQALWRTRKALSPALRKIAPKKINEDVVVPVSRIPALLEGLEKLSQQYAIPIVNFGHAGNGNIHVNLLVDPGNHQQMQNAQRCLSDVFDLVLSLNGTLSGEHGVGLEKKDFVGREIEPATLALMKKIKQQFDPNNILNPGKMLPD